MSYNPDPNWTEDFIIPDENELSCPVCNETPEDAGDIMDTLKSLDYYEPRHIPPHLLLTCYNLDCSHCDEDFKVYLRAVVSVVKTVAVTT